MIERKVMMPDGIVRERHSVCQITHLIGSMTTIDVNSTNASGDNLYCWQHAVECDTTIDESGAYDIIGALPSMVEYVDPVDTLLDILTDEQAESMTDLYPSWTVDVAYAVGDRRKYDGKLYRCIQAHTSQSGWEPNVTPALWVRTAEDGEIPEWVQPTGAQDAYAKGDKVTHNDKTWVSLVDGNVWEPGATGTESLWAEVTDEE